VGLGVLEFREGDWRNGKRFFFERSLPGSEAKKSPPPTSTAFDVYFGLALRFRVVVIKAHVLDATIFVHQAEGREFADRRDVTAQVKARRLRILIGHVELRRFACVPDPPFFALKLARTDLKGDNLRSGQARVDANPPPTFAGLR
jgi:hypothetical protein